MSLNPNRRPKKSKAKPQKRSPRGQSYSKNNHPSTKEKRESSTRDTGKKNTRKKVIKLLTTGKWKEMISKHFQSGFHVFWHENALKVSDISARSFECEKMPPFSELKLDDGTSVFFCKSSQEILRRVLSSRADPKTRTTTRECIW